MRKLATIRKILHVQKHPNADSLEIVDIGGWKCIAKIGEFKKDDLVLYLEIDSFLPIKPEFEFLRNSSYRKLEDGTEGFRLRTIKLRGQVSQGLVLPFSMFPNIDFSDTKKDYSEELGITKYEPPVPAQLAGEVIGQFPTYIVPRTNQERVQNLVPELKQLCKLEYELTEKLDGTSTTIYLYNQHFGICSRNLEFKLPNENLEQYKIVKEHMLENKMKAYNRNIAIQGEIIGAGIQGNPYKLQTKEFYVFDIWDIDSQNYLKPDERIIICNMFGLKHVPIIHKYFQIKPNKLIEQINKNLTSEEYIVRDLLDMANGKSLINKNVDREGLVFKSTTLHNGNISSFKVISNNYLLGEK